MKRSDLDNSERHEYDRMRAAGYGVAAAMMSTTRDRGGPDVPTDDGDTFERDGFTLRVHVSHDEYMDIGDCGVGSFTSTWSDGCLDRAAEGYRVERNQHPYFLPDITQAEHEASGPNVITPAEARRYVLEDLKRAEGFGSEWWYMSLRVTAHREGVELGSAGLGGTETDCGERYKRQLIDDLAGEAIAEARAALGRLCTSGG